MMVFVISTYRGAEYLQATARIQIQHVIKALPASVKYEVHTKSCNLILFNLLRKFRRSVNYQHDQNFSEKSVIFDSLYFK